MKTILKILSIFAALVVAQNTLAADMTGTWLVHLEMNGDTSDSVFRLAQKEESLTGSYKGRLGEATVAGTIRNNEFVFTYHIEVQGVPIDVTYMGTMNGSAIAGKLSFAGYGDGTFTGVKQ